MTEKTLISNYQAILLTLFSNIPTAVFYIPGVAITFANHDAWIPIIIGAFMVALLVIYPLANLGMKYPGQTIFQYSEKIMGKFLGKTFGAFLVIFLLQIHAWTLRNFAEVIVIFLPETPIVVIIIIIALVMAYAVYNGIEVIGRCAEFVFPLGLFSLGIIFITSFQKIDISNLMPVMKSGILPIIRATIFPMDWLSLCLPFGIITAFVANKNDLKKIGYTSIGLAGTILTLFSIIVISVLGISIITVRTFPLLTLARYSQLPSMERIESVIMILWITWLFMRGAISCFSTVLGLSQVLNLADYRLFIIAESILAVSYSIFQYDNFAEMSYIFSIANLEYMFFQIGIPFTLWVVSLARAKTL